MVTQKNKKKSDSPAIQCHLRRDLVRVAQSDLPFHGRGHQDIAIHRQQLAVAEGLGAGEFHHRSGCGAVLLQRRDVQLILERIVILVGTYLQQLKLGEGAKGSNEMVALSRASASW